MRYLATKTMSRARVFVCPMQYIAWDKIYSTRKPSWRKSYARQADRAVIPRWLSAAILDFMEPVIRSTDPKNPCLEPNVEWIGCIVCKIFTFKLLWPWNWGSESLKVIKSGTVRYSTYDFIFVFLSNYASIYYLYLLSIIWIWNENILWRFLITYDQSLYLLPPCIWRPCLGWSRQIWATTLGDKKNQNDGPIRK